MLVLSRTPNQIVDIGPEIQVQVLSIRGNKVKLGFVAPAAVAVNRREVTEAIARGEEREPFAPTAHP